MMQLKNLEKEQTKPKSIQQQEVRKTRASINEAETKKTVILITHDTILFDVASRCIQIG